MRVRVILRIALREQEGGRLHAEELHNESYRLMEALLRSGESQEIWDVRTSGDAEVGLVTAEAIVEAHGEKAGAERFAGIVRTLLAAIDKDRPDGERRLRYEIEEPEGTRL